MIKDSIQLVAFCVLTQAFAGYTKAGVSEDYSWLGFSATFHVGDLVGEGQFWQDAFEEAAGRWNDTPTSFRVLIAQSGSQGFCTSFGNSSAQWSFTNCGDEWGENTLAITQTWYSGSSINKSDISFNANLDWDVYDGELLWYSNDFRRVAVHELGHALGLGHSLEADAVMYAFASDTFLPILDDVNTLRSVYGSNDHELTLIIDGGGSIKVEPLILGTGVVVDNILYSSNYGSVLGCSGAVCTHIIQDGLRLSIEALPTQGQSFIGWEGTTVTSSSVSLAPFSGPRTLKAIFSSFSSSSNTDLNSATPVALQSTTEGFLNVGSQLYYKITLTEPGVLNAVTEGSTDTVGRLLDSSGNELLTDDDGSVATNFLLSQNLEAGTYYIVVGGYNNLVSGDFSLVLEFEAEVLISQAKNDFNGDGKSDYLLREVSQSNRAWMLSIDNDSTILQGITEQSHWKYQASPDLDGDGQADLVVRSGSWYGYLMDGVTSLENGTLPLTSNLDWILQASGDFDGDGRGDLLLRHQVTGSWYVYLMDGLTVKSSGGVGGASANMTWQFRAVADFDGDGKDDILLQNTVNLAWYIYRMNGLQAYSLSEGSGVAQIPASNKWHFSGVGDFSADGKSDVVLRRTDGPWFVVPMDGLEKLTDQNFGLLALTANTLWQPKSIADYTGDGRADILLRNQITGLWYLYPLNGREKLSSDEGFVPLTSDFTWELVE